MLNNMNTIEFNEVDSLKHRTDDEVIVGDKVEFGTYVLGKWCSMGVGIIVSQSPDNSISDVDRMSLHGGAPWIVKEETSKLRKIQ